MIPSTANGMAAMECVSAMQKCIRRGLEREAMEFAVEMIHTSKSFFTMVCNRLEVTCHEDIDTISQPWIPSFVHSTIEAARAHYKPEKPQEARLMIGNVIRLLSRATKSREGCHFSASVGLKAQQDGFKPDVPDWAKDMHTLAGRRLGRGLGHFLSEGAKLVPPAKPDAYEAEAVKQWERKYAKSKPEFDGDGEDSNGQTKLF